MVSSLQQGDKVLLIIEDDVKFAPIMATLAREQGFSPVVALRGDTGLALAHQLQPDAITLDFSCRAPTGAACSIA